MTLVVHSFWVIVSRTCRLFPGLLKGNDCETWILKRNFSVQKTPFVVLIKTKKLYSTDSIWPLDLRKNTLFDFFSLFPHHVTSFMLPRFYWGKKDGNLFRRRTNTWYMKKNHTLSYTAIKAVFCTCNMPLSIL